MPRATRALFLILQFLFAARLFAQTDITYTPQIPTHGVGHDYINLLNETVNPADGNVDLTINIPLPKDRGITIPFSLVYSSSTLGVMNNRSLQDFLSFAGWSYTFPVLSYVQGKFQIGTVNEADGNNEPQYCYYSSDYTFHAPGTGSQHSLGLSQTNPYGYPENGAVCGTIPALVGGDYAYQATLGNNLACQPICVTQGATVADADGTIYYFSGALDWGGGASQGELLAMPSYIEDRNGNRITITNNYSSCCAYSGGASIVDAAGRTALSTTGFGATGNTIAVSGLSNPFTLTWATHTNLLIPATEYGQSVDKTSICSQAGTSGPVEYPSLGPGITQLTLPNGQSYRFSYDSTYGLLNKITYPNGGYVSYTWGLNKNSSAFMKVETDPEDGTFYCVYTVDQPAVVQRQVSFDGQTIALTQQFNYSTSWSSPQIGWIGSETTTVTTTDKVTGLTYSTVYTYSATNGGTPPNDPARQPQGFNIYYPSQEQTIQYYKDTNTAGTPLRTVTKGWLDPDDLVCEIDTLDNGSISGVFNAYKPGGIGPIQLLTDKREYDYGLLTSASQCINSATAPSGVVPTRETTTSYQVFGAQPLYLQPTTSVVIPTILDRPATAITYGNVSGSSQEVAETDYYYDQSSVSSISATGHDETNYSSTSTAPRGNVTTKVTQCLQGCPRATITYAHNELGQVTSITDPCGNSSCSDMSGSSHTTSYSYGPATAYAYLATVTDALGHNEQFEYNLSSGELSFFYDQNDQGTNYLYNDPFERLTEANYPDGGHKTYSYDDSPYSKTAPSPSVTTTTAITNTGSSNTTTVAAADGIGHSVQTQFTSDPDGTDLSFTSYDGLGRKHSITNSYRTTADSTYGSIVYSYDALGRAMSVTEADNSTIHTTYCGPSTLVVDEAGRWRRSTNDGLGRLVRVDEPNSLSATVTACPQSGDPVVTTSYTYDALNNLTGVMQGGSRQRTFVYDSLSRLLASCNPENCTGQGSVTVPGLATGTITFSCAGTCTGNKILTYVGGTGTGNLCTTFFTSGESVSAVATATAATINSTSSCSKYVTAAASGAVVTLTSNTSGAAGDYSFSASTNGTYTVTTSGATLTPGEAYTILGGSTQYVYDVNGNLTSKTSPAQNQTGTATVTVSYCYDNLNRAVSKAYIAQACPMTTPVATYTYDQTACLGQSSCYNIGHRTGMTDSAGSENWSYDQMGRVLRDQRTTNAITKTSVYTYLPYVDGALNTLQYPSGDTITFTTGQAERLLAAVDTANSIYYATGAHYSPQGTLASLTNNDTIFTTQIFNQRLQPCWSYVTTGTPLSWNTTLCTATDSTPGNLLDLQYKFNLGSGDNGNVMGITNNRDTTRSQAFTYDWLNRISTAETTSTDSTSAAHCWSQVFGYDIWANLYSIQPGSSAYSGCSEPSAFSSTATAQNQLSGFGYDAAGNITSNSPASYVYDAENHLTSTEGVTYVYDGDGKRVEKSGSKIYWYGADGDVLDETDQTGSTTNSSFNEYVYFAGARIARKDASGDVFYYFADHLGTSRTIVQILSGQTTSTLCYDAEFYPFGGERAYTNNCPQNYKFTGKERDNESGLDDFGARHYANAMGRFMTPDKPFADQHLVDPQSLNLYAYVRDSPLSLVDDTGEGARPADDARINSYFSKSVNTPIRRAILASNNYSVGAFESEMSQGANYLGPKLIGAAGEAVMFGRLADSNPFGNVAFQPRVPGNEPDLAISFEPTIFSDRAALSNIVGARGGIVPMDSGSATIYFEVKIGSDFSNLLKGATQAAQTASALDPHSNTASVLVVDQGVYNNLSQDQQQQLQKAAGGGLIQLQPNLNRDAAELAAKTRKEACAAAPDKCK